MTPKQFPINCYCIDHYTLIVPNAKVVADFHERVLGYELINTILVNAGSAPEGQYDMLNYVMAWPNSQKGVMVVTEGLTKESIFHKFMMKYGQGIHHIAFEIEHINEVFELLKANGIEVTSDHLLRDPLSGLKQFFISSKYTGIFIEMIERKSENEEDKQSEEQGFFTQDNMSGLASTMQSYLDSDLQQDEDIRKLDTSVYFAQAEKMKIEKINNLSLHVAEVDRAKDFLRNILGFEIRENGIVNPNEPDKHIELVASNPHGDGIIPANMTLAANDLAHNRAVLQNLDLKFSESGQGLTLDESYVGYPMTLWHN